MMDNYETLLGLGGIAISLSLAANFISYPAVKKYIREFEAENGRADALQKTKEFLRSTSNPISKIFYVGDRKAMNEYLSMKLF